MKQVTVELEQIGGIALAGSAYDQGGVPGAVRSGRSVARRVLETLSL
jgi:protoporphyrinogen oxidase